MNRASLRFRNALRTGILVPPNLYDQDAQAFLARITALPVKARQDLINERFVEGKKKSFWAKLDALWVHAAHDPQAGHLNWLGDIYNCIPVNNPVFTADRGYVGDGSSSYLNTQFNPSMAVSPKYTQDSGSVGIRSNTENVGTGSLAGFYDTVLQRGTTINPRIDNTNSVASYRLNAGSTGANTPNGAAPSSIGMFIANRTSPAGVSGFRNGVKLVAGTQQPSTLPANGSIRLGSVHASSYRACQFSMAFIGAGLTDQEVIDIYNWFEPYRIAVGVP